MKTISGPNFTVLAPDDWDDITDEVGSVNPAFTLAAEKGVGALQFSTARYRSGQIPNPQSKDLLDMIVEFGNSHQLGEMENIVMEDKPVILAAATFCHKIDTVRVWQVSNGRSFALVTYICESKFFGDEIEKCEDILHSIKFAA